MDEITKEAIQFVPNDIKETFKNAAYLMNAALNFIKDIESIVQECRHTSLFSSKDKTLSQVAITMHEKKDALQ